MSFSRDDVEVLARLARLALTPGEQDLFARQLAGIVEYARQVRDVDTTGATAPVAPAAPVRLREDEVRPSLDRRDVLDAAPDADQAAGLIKVPRVLG